MPPPASVAVFRPRLEELEPRDTPNDLFGGLGASALDRPADAPPEPRDPDPPPALAAERSDAPAPASALLVPTAETSVRVEEAAGADDRTPSASTDAAFTTPADAPTVETLSGPVAPLSAGTFLAAPLAPLTGAAPEGAGPAAPAAPPLAPASVASAPQETPTSPPAERIVFLGDSLTYRGAAPGGFVALLGSDLHSAAPPSGVATIDAGVPGDRVPDLQARLDRDVLAQNPTLVVVAIGVNDAWGLGRGDPTIYGTDPAVYAAGLRDVVGRIQATGARVVLCTPAVVGERPDGGNSFDARMDLFAAISRQVAHDTGATLVDLRQAFLNYEQAHNPNNLSSGVLTVDGVHLNAAGNQLMAEQLLAALRQ
jgi:lysophospholipase L1-like esterase